ncbi:MAG: hypothetical protein DME30_05420 [Verrucomicrobia bacterium]|nr:MAG: hypothetical protein DME30_05420 [Verrucomicrobiota bacterium]
MQRGQRAIAIGFFVSTLTLLGAALKPDGAVSSQTMPIQSASSTLPDQPFFFQPPGVQINPPGPAATSLPLAPSAGGTWTVVSSPNTSATEHNFLQNVTCMSASDCWAVGTSFAAGAVTQTLIERWDGTAWTIVSSPNAGVAQGNFLYGVTCVSTSECWAAGYYNAAGAAQTLIERWDGTSWAIVSSPNTSTTRNNFLYGVTCVSASECWAVGGHYTGSVNQTLIERWDGISWAIVNSPSTNAAEHNQFYGVTCPSALDCWAVGFYKNSLTGNNQTLMERWDGNSWALVPSPNTLSIQDNHLFAVTCVSESECWAVGDYVNSNALSRSVQTLIERWDGTSWAVIASPNASTQTDVLFGVSCRSASDCWAAGYQTTNSVSQTLIEQWDGKAWTIASSADTSATKNPVLHAVNLKSPGRARPMARVTFTSRAMRRKPNSRSRPTHFKKNMAMAARMVTSRSTTKTEICFGRHFLEDRTGMESSA